MSPSLRAPLLALGALLVACQPEVHRGPLEKVEPPVAHAAAIPDAPLNGTLRGAKFVVKDARYVLDHRSGYLRADIKLSAGAAESPCGDILPARSPSVWLRLEKSDKIESQELLLDPAQPGPWSVHYQIREDDHWVGNGDGAAVVSLRAPGGDGNLSGSLAVCFADGAKSCVSGSFEAKPCPYQIDAPVRGALPVETIPERYVRKGAATGAAPTATVAPAALDAGAPPPPRH